MQSQLSDPFLLDYGYFICLIGEKICQPSEIERRKKRSIQDMIAKRNAI
jgi:hypothetical protein